MAKITFGTGNDEFISAGQIRKGLTFTCEMSKFATKTQLSAFSKLTSDEFTR